VGCGRGGEGGGVDRTPAAAKELSPFRTPPAPPLLPTSSIHGSILSTPKRSGAQRSRVTSANPPHPLQICPSFLPCPVFNGTLTAPPASRDHRYFKP